MQIHVIDPNGKRHGPFSDRKAAVAFGTKRWPEKPCDDREENPDAWEIQINKAD